MVSRRFSSVLIVVILDTALVAGCSCAAMQVNAQPAPVTAPAASLPLTLRVTEPLGVARSHWPISGGVPFASAVLTDPSQLRIVDEQHAAVTLQARVLSRWPDRSVRWVLLDWQADLKPHEERRFQVHIGAPMAPSSVLKVSDREDGIEVDTGPLRFTVPKQRFAVLSDVSLHGKPAVTGPVVAFFDVDGKRIEAQAPTFITVSESGPLRARIEMRGHYAALFDYVLRIDAFANQPFVRIFHTFEQHSSEPYVLVRQLAIDIPLAMKGKIAYRAGVEHGAPLQGTLQKTGFALFQEDNELLHAGGVRRSGRAAGWVDVHDAARGVTLAARFFWPQYPQSVQVQPRGVTYNLWAPEAPPAKVGMGAAKTHEMVLDFHGPSAVPPATLAGLSEPLRATVDPHWIVATDALRNSVAPGPATSGFLQELAAGYGRYQEHAAVQRWDDSGQVSCPDPVHERPRTGFFGMLNWGDWNYPGYHDTTKGCDAWGNLEYDMTQVLALAYAATGQRAYFEGMVAAARHFMDVDRIHYQREHPNWIGMNHPKNPLHFAFELGGVDLGHTWTEGLLSYYYLTGDERGLEAARSIADYLIRRLHASVARGNPRQWGWPQIALVAAYEATGDAAYKDAAQEYARRGMAAHPPDRVADWKMGILAEALSYTHSVTHEPTLRDWLVRYAAAVTAHGGKADARYFPAIAYIGRVTGNAQYTRAATALASRLQFGNWGKPFTIAGRLGFSILSEQPPPTLRAETVR